MSSFTFSYIKSDLHFLSISSNSKLCSSYHLSLALSVVRLISLFSCLYFLFPPVYLHFPLSLFHSIISFVILGFLAFFFLLCLCFSLFFSELFPILINTFFYYILRDRICKISSIVSLFQFFPPFTFELSLLHVHILILF